MLDVTLTFDNGPEPEVTPAVLDTLARESIRATFFVRHLAAGGYTCVLWNAIPRDFDDAETWPEQASNLMRPLRWALVVLHDLPGGAMAHLDRFIAMTRAAGGRLRQDFPPDCVPLRRGREVLPMHAYVAEEAPILQA